MLSKSIFLNKSSESLKPIPVEKLKEITGGHEGLRITTILNPDGPNNPHDVRIDES